MGRVATDWRLRAYGRLVVVGTVIGFIVAVAGSDGARPLVGNRLGGDFPAFWTAGILARTNPAGLLDVGVQAQLQQDVVFNDSFLPFPYPPPVAYLLVPLGLLRFLPGYVLAVVLLAGIAVGVAVALARWLDVSPERREIAVLGALTFGPTLHAITGTQTSVITLGLVLVGFWLMEQNEDVLAGSVLGLLWFKPQFAIPVLGLLLVGARRVRAALVMTGALIVWYLVGIPSFGGDWPAVWLRDVVAFTNEGNLLRNVDATVSPVEYVRGLGAPWGETLGGLVAVCFGVGALLAFRAANSWVHRVAITGVALLLTAPHALQYELVLLVPALAVILQRRGEKYRGRVLLWWVLGAAAVAPAIPWFRVTLVAWIAWELIRSLDLQVGTGRADPSDQVSAA